MTPLRLCGLPKSSQPFRPVLCMGKLRHRRTSPKATELGDRLGGVTPRPLTPASVPHLGSHGQWAGRLRRAVGRTGGRHCTDTVLLVTRGVEGIPRCPSCPLWELVWTGSGETAGRQGGMKGFSSLCWACKQYLLDVEENQTWHASRVGFSKIYGRNFMHTSHFLGGAHRTSAGAERP